LVQELSSQSQSIQRPAGDRYTSLIAAKAAYQRALQLAPADVKPKLAQELSNIEMQTKQ
jgi:hypothetical protein